MFVLCRRNVMDLAFSQHQHASGQMSDLFLLVCDKADRMSAVAQVGQQRQQPVGARRIKTGERFIEQQNGWIVD